ncbi:MAG: FecR domain-containing protein [Prolixibacteraceae bacterium]|jgi:ferric-dicitrate binding protein FerR (iron transport regulator)
MKENKEIQKNIRELLDLRRNQDPDEQLAEASRIVSEIETVDSSAAFSQVLKRIQKEKQSIFSLNALSRIAAILFIPLLVASGWLLYRQITAENVQQFSMQEITSPPGIRSQVVLPDGTKVWLNAETTIQFPVPFSKNSRNVELLGEAFFYVTKNPEKPFIVHSGNVSVKVLGTHFNCKAYSSDKNIDVILEEGKIALNVEGNATAKEYIMVPGQHAIVGKSDSKTTILKENIHKYIAWHTGKLVFDNTPMSEVAQLIERWYGVNVIVQDPEIMNYRFTTTFENESLFQVIELLGLSSPIRFNYVPAKVNSNNQMESKLKLLISKK